MYSLILEPFRFIGSNQKYVLFIFFVLPHDLSEYYLNVENFNMKTSTHNRPYSSSRLPCEFIYGDSASNGLPVSQSLGYTSGGLPTLLYDVETTV